MIDLIQYEEASQKISRQDLTIVLSWDHVKDLRQLLLSEEKSLTVKKHH